MMISMVHRENIIEPHPQPLPGYPHQPLQQFPRLLQCHLVLPNLLLLLLPRVLFPLLVIECVIFLPFPRVFSVCYSLSWITMIIITCVKFIPPFIKLVNESMFVHRYLHIISISPWTRELIRGPSRPEHDYVDLTTRKVIVILITSILLFPNM